ncbi:hypothetical protein V440_15760 [Clostridioides difficile]|nr:hypothetical protein V440_15760 [Clostridioides difficile]
MVIGLLENKKLLYINNKNKLFRLKVLEFKTKRDNL